MGKEITLVEIVEELGSYGDEEDIYAREPWTPDSPVIVLNRPESPGLPEKASNLGMVYFIAAFIAQEFLEDWVKAQSKKPTYREQCERLIQYAIYDA